MRTPPNIDELGNLVLLRQALDILEAPAEVQGGLYPSDRDPSEEIRALFRDAWTRVRPVFAPLLPMPGREALDRIDRAFDREPAPLDDPAWDAIRGLAGRASAVFPEVGRPRAPRAWLDQIVRERGRLRLRRQGRQEAAD